MQILEAAKTFVEKNKSRTVQAGRLVGFAAAVKGEFDFIKEVPKAFMNLGVNVSPEYLASTLLLVGGAGLFFFCDRLNNQRPQDSGTGEIAAEQESHFFRPRLKLGYLIPVVGLVEYLHNIKQLRGEPDLIDNIARDLKSDRKLQNLRGTIENAVGETLGNIRTSLKRENLRETLASFATLGVSTWGEPKSNEDFKDGMKTALQNSTIVAANWAMTMEVLFQVAR